MIILMKHASMGIRTDQDQNNGWIMLVQWRAWLCCWQLLSGLPPFLSD